MRLFRKLESETKGRAGYSASYVADVELLSKSDSLGVIVVDIPRSTKTTPHAHGTLEEVFIVMNRTKMGVGDSILELESGDTVVAEPHEDHWFETYDDEDVRVIALKIPNLKDDKIN